jgi:hypothetical protein
MGDLAERYLDEYSYLGLHRGGVDTTPSIDRLAHVIHSLYR